MNLAGQGLEWERSNVLSSALPKQFLADGDFCEFNYWPLSPMTAGIIDTGLIGECEVDLVFDSNAATITTQGQAVSATEFGLENIRAYVDVIDLESDFYRKFASAALGRGKTMVKMMELATCVIQSSNGSNNFNVSTGCLDKILVAPKASAWATARAQIDGEVYDRYLDFTCGAAYGADANYGVYVQIGSTSFPAYGFGRNFTELASLTRNNWAGSSYNYNKLFLQTDASGSTIAASALEYAPAAYNVHNAVVLIPVGAFDEHGKQGGIDLSSGNSVIRVETQGANLASATSQLLMAGVHKSLLQVQSGQVVSYTN